MQIPPEVGWIRHSPRECSAPTRVARNGTAVRRALTDRFAPAVLLEPLAVVVFLELLEERDEFGFDAGGAHGSFSLNRNAPSDFIPAAWTGI